MSKKQQNLPSHVSEQKTDRLHTTTQHILRRVHA